MLHHRDAENTEKDLSRAKAQSAPSSERFFLCGPFDQAQGMLCAFARQIPAFGGGCTALCCLREPEFRLDSAKFMRE